MREREMRTPRLMGVVLPRSSAWTLLTFAALLTGSSWNALAAPGPDTLVLGRPASRSQAIAVLSSGSPLPIPCLTPIVQNLQRDAQRMAPAVRRAYATLIGEAQIPGERRFLLPDGTLYRYSLERSTFDRMDLDDADRDGTPDAVEAAAEGLALARRLLVQDLELPSPGPVEVLLANVGGNVDGYLLTRRRNERRFLIVLHATPHGGVPEIRRAALHQYAHAVVAASGPSLAPGWGEALATWAQLQADGGPDAGIALLLARRLRGLASGLLSDDLDLAAGNAAWLEFLESAYGPGSVRLTIEELGQGGPASAALDRALRRAAGENLASAFREFHLWSVLTGPRSDRRHFAFAGRLAAPAFASVFEGLPALAVQPDPAVAPLGAVQALIAPEEDRGGMTVRFEGEVPGLWQADLLLASDTGELRRVPMGVGADGRTHVTVPLDGLAEAVLLVRNLDDSGPPRRYSWSANREEGYPFELASLEASLLEGERGGVLLRWETASEQGLVGFNVLRTREDGGEVLRINPVWIPAIGDASMPALYQFLDMSADAGGRYRYRIEGVTTEGLSSVSAPISVAAQ